MERTLKHQRKTEHVNLLMAPDLLDRIEALRADYPPEQRPSLSATMRHLIEVGLDVVDEQEANMQEGHIQRGNIAWRLDGKSSRHGTMIYLTERQRAQLEQIAEREGLSLSSAGSLLLERAMADDPDYIMRA